LYVSDFNFVIRKISPTGVVSAFVGTPSNNYSFADGTGAAAGLGAMEGMTIDNNGNLYVGDIDNDRVRKISSAGVVTTIAGTGQSGSNNGLGSVATFDNPTCAVSDAAGNVYVCDSRNNMIRKITPTGMVTTLAGVITTGSGIVDGNAATASFRSPYGIVIDNAGNLFVCENASNKIRKITFN
jgi:sugar lactone lactonase YvrE